ncbi:MAG: ribosome biogenesis GTPase YlqF [Clostridiaceae bacterium]|nr:ribosome biogenesis GTPase YlqF [Clostridiaceae bacterium]
MAVNWFPGHMARALREIKEHLSMVDVVLETCDARIPESSRNPELNHLIGAKPRILVLTKTDLADPAVTEEWILLSRRKNLMALACDSTRRSSLTLLIKTITDLSQEKTDRALARGRIFRPVRVMVTGIPNTGKSTLINTLCGRKLVQTADKPGVTKQLSWARSGGRLELLDSPGVLWPQLGQRSNQLHLAATGAIRDDILPLDEIAGETLKEIMQLYPGFVQARYGQLDGTMLPGDLLAAAAAKRGCFMSGGRVDTARFSALFLDEFRSGRIGRISLERPAK